MASGAGVAEAASPGLAIGNANVADGVADGIVDEPGVAEGTDDGVGVGVGGGGMIFSQ